ncbi:hypothetical protein [Rhizomonospora bruguierae]|uniref:hypothetical protein n=1 Tax=Rhizomonospora bruguierae TaxID=1581705 RepID=UPI001BD19B1B|nr:hypothetical protein [Micromonospora sp. NBRC 107566]
MALTGDYTYFKDGTTRLDMSDGSSSVYSGTGNDTVTLSRTLASGTKYTEFDSDGNPGHVEFPDGKSGNYTYLSDGTTRLDVSDGSSTVFSGSGDNAVILEQTDPNGTVYTNFDESDRPLHVEFSEVDISSRL